VKLEIGPLRRGQVTDSVGDATAYRQEVSLRFDQLCRLTGMNNSALAGALRDRLGRPTLTRQTLTGWRNGAQPVPAEAFLVALELAGPDARTFLVHTFEDSFAKLMTRLGTGRESLSEHAGRAG
jgi:hypothetical protein